MAWRLNENVRPRPGDQMKSRSIIPVCLLPFLLAACAVGPDYVRPTVETPAAFKEMQGWKTAQPRDQEIRGKWWQAFNDPLLDALEEQVSVSNQDLATAAARFRQAQ